MKAFEVCSNTANFIPELRALQTSVGHMLSPHGLFWAGGGEGGGVDTIRGLN